MDDCIHCLQWTNVNSTYIGWKFTGPLLLQLKRFPFQDLQWHSSEPWEPKICSNLGLMDTACTISQVLQQLILLCNLPYDHFLADPIVAFSAYSCIHMIVAQVVAQWMLEVILSTSCSCSEVMELIMSSVYSGVCSGYVENSKWAYPCASSMELFRIEAQLCYCTASYAYVSMWDFLGLCSYKGAIFRWHDCINECLSMNLLQDLCSHMILLGLLACAWIFISLCHSS